MCVYWCEHGLQLLLARTCTARGRDADGRQLRQVATSHHPLLARRCVLDHALGDFSKRTARNTRRSSGVKNARALEPRPNLLGLAVVVEAARDLDSNEGGTRRFAGRTGGAGAWNSSRRTYETRDNFIGHSRTCSCWRRGGLRRAPGAGEVRRPLRVEGRHGRPRRGEPRFPRPVARPLGPARCTAASADSGAAPAALDFRRFRGRTSRARVSSPPLTPSLP